jgi:hypothetical protein
MNSLSTSGIFGGEVATDRKGLSTAHPSNTIFANITRLARAKERGAAHVFNVPAAEQLKVTQRTLPRRREPRRETRRLPQSIWSPSPYGQSAKVLGAGLMGV